MIEERNPSPLFPRVSRPTRGVGAVTFNTAGLILIAVITLGAATSQSQTGTADDVVVRPIDPGTALENPGMGWVFHY